MRFGAGGSNTICHYHLSASPKFKEADVFFSEKKPKSFPDPSCFLDVPDIF